MGTIQADYHEQDYGTPPQRVRGVLRYHPAAALELPPPDETFRLQELLDQPHWNRSLAHVATRHSIIERAEHNSQRGHLWRTTPDVYAWVVDTIEPPKLTPCGHQGIRCVESGETYTCALPDTECDEQFGREAAEAVIGDE